MKRFGILVLFFLLNFSAVVMAKTYDCHSIEKNVYTQKECTSEITENVIKEIAIINLPNNISRNLTNKDLRKALGKPDNPVIFHENKDPDSEDLFPETIVWSVTYTNGEFVVTDNNIGITFKTIIIKVIQAIIWTIVILYLSFFIFG